MKSVTVKKIELLTLLKENKEKHVEQVAKAEVGYWVEVAEAKDKLTRLVAKLEVQHLTIHITKPESHIVDYETAIKMLEMHQGDTIEIDKEEFENFALDKWDWKERWSMSNSKYWSNADGK